MVEEIDIEWIPEDTGAPYEVDMNQVLMDMEEGIIYFKNSRNV